MKVIKNFKDKTNQKKQMVTGDEYVTDYKRANFLIREGYLELEESDFELIGKLEKEIEENKKLLSEIEVLKKTQEAESTEKDKTKENK